VYATHRECWGDFASAFQRGEHLEPIMQEWALFFSLDRRTRVEWLNCAATVWNKETERHSPSLSEWLKLGKPLKPAHLWPRGVAAELAPSPRANTRGKDRSPLLGQPDAKLTPCAATETVKNEETTVPQPVTPPEPPAQPTEPDGLMSGNPSAPPWGQQAGESPGPGVWPQDARGTYTEATGFVSTRDRQRAEERARTVGEPDEGEIG
jgi:hypothetical protein